MFVCLCMCTNSGLIRAYTHTNLHTRLDCANLYTNPLSYWTTHTYTYMAWIPKHVHYPLSCSANTHTHAHTDWIPATFFKIQWSFCFFPTHTHTRARAHVNIHTLLTHPNLYTSPGSYQTHTHIYTHKHTRLEFNSILDRYKYTHTHTQYIYNTDIHGLTHTNLKTSRRSYRTPTHTYGLNWYPFLGSYRTYTHTHTHIHTYIHTRLESLKLRD